MNFNVVVKVTGFITVPILAESKDEAYARAMDDVDLINEDRFIETGRWVYSIENETEEETKEEEMPKGTIVEDNGVLRYFDKEGNELHDGDLVLFGASATIEGKPIRRKVYLTEHDELGVDATNPAWIERGLAVPCQYGIYPLDSTVMKDALLIKEEEKK